MGAQLHSAFGTRHSAFNLLLSICILACSACGTPNLQEATSIRVDLGRTEQERLLKYYFGGYASTEGADPFEAGLLTREAEGYSLDLQKLGQRVPGFGEILRDRDQNSRLDWDDLEPFLESTYYQVRELPATLPDLQIQTGYLDSLGWMRVDIDGVMTTATRRIHVPYGAIQDALKAYGSNESRVLYPIGTTIVAEHWADDLHVETTAMRKRGDGYWDYFVYDAAGRLAPATSTEPRSLVVPTRCVGCHFGDKKFEPETSFPGESTPGPHGPRGIYVDRNASDHDIVESLNEHVRRSDTVLGPYATLYLLKLRRKGDVLTPEESEILQLMTGD